MRYIAETIEREVIGPFLGKRFSSMSDDVVDALLTVEYRFDGFTITIAGIPARWDRTTGAEYVAGKVAREVNERLTTLAGTVAGQWPGSIDILRVARPQLPLDQKLQAKGGTNHARLIADTVLRETPLRVSLNLPRAA